LLIAFILSNDEYRSLCHLVEITPLVIFSLLKLSPVSKINAAISEYDMFFINSDLNGSAME
ncbi:hypothetical protein, partial [Salmonella enterica]